MTLTLKTSLVFFYLTGMSLKAFPRTRSFCQFFIFIWSYLAAAVNVYVAAFIVLETKIGDNSPEIVLFLRVYHANFCICTFSCLFISLGCKSSEEIFWKLLKKLDSQLFNPVSETFIQKCFRRCLKRFLILALAPIVISYFLF